MIESVLDPPGDAKLRHATITAPVRGSIAIVDPWLMGSCERLMTTGALHVTPQLSERDRKICERRLAPVPVIAVQLT